ncbi:MAG: 50S ribosomal protein L6 [Rickettsiales bacterium]|nr:MAG: 50S ribosomal protein L6 [Rickettsiales bacterium]
MSRVGKLPIKVPSDIKVEVNAPTITITKGSVKKEYDFGNKVNVSFENNEIKVAPKPELKLSEVENYYGLHRNNLANIVQGLIQPYKITLEINGVGFKSSVIKNNLILTLGYSHDIAVGLPQNVKATIEQNLINLESDDKQLVGQIASKIISLRKPEPYKGKGVKIAGKPILRKEGKKK